MTSYSGVAHGRPNDGRTFIVLASGERRTGVSVSAALLAVASSDAGPALCIEAGERIAGIRWNSAMHPELGFAALASGAPVQRVALGVSRTLDAIQARGSGDAGDPHRPKAAFEQLQGVLHLYETIVVDASTSIAALVAACEAGVRTGARVELVMLASPGGASLAATHALLKAARRMGVRARASVLVASHDHATAAGMHAMLAAASERFLGESPGFAGVIAKDASLSIALNGGMTLLDSAAGSPALDSAIEVVRGLRQSFGIPRDMANLHNDSPWDAVNPGNPVAAGAALPGARVE